MTMVSRGDVRYDAILRATLHLLAEVGYDQMTMDAIAQRARASKATIYRRWAGKADMVADALRLSAEEPAEPPETGSLRGDLVAVLRHMCATLAEQDASVVLGLLTAMRRDPHLAEAVRRQVLEVKTAAFDAVLNRAAECGALPRTADRATLVELCSAMLFSRRFITGETLDTDFVEHMVDVVLMPLIEGHAARR
jgi:AcrR family transcriptional regulator